MLSNIKISRIKKLFLFCIIAILALNVLPINPPSSKFNNIYLLELRADYIVHVMIFMPWMIFHGVVFEQMNFLKWMCLGFIFSFLMECIQYFLPYRTFNINDAVANEAGIAIGSLAVLIKKNKFRNERVG